MFCPLSRIHIVVSNLNDGTLHTTGRGATLLQSAAYHDDIP